MSNPDQPEKPVPDPNALSIEDLIRVCTPEPYPHRPPVIVVSQKQYDWLRESGLVA